MVSPVPQENFQGAKAAQVLLAVQGFTASAPHTSLFSFSDGEQVLIECEAVRCFSCFSIYENTSPRSIPSQFWLTRSLLLHGQKED